MSNSDPAAAPVLKYPSNFLPGLKLRTLEEDVGASTALTSSLAPSPSDVVICLKHFNPEFKIFPGQDPSLTVTYGGGIEDATPELIEGDSADFYGKILPTEETETPSSSSGDVQVATLEEELDIVAKVYEKSETPPVDAYYCFHLRVDDDWTSEGKTKDIETIELSVSVHSDDGGVGETGEPTQKQEGSTVGESFVIDLAEVNLNHNQNEPKFFFLDWDMSNVYMRQVFSPEEIAEFKKEKGVAQDVLFLGAADNKSYSPIEPFNIHVNLFDVGGNPDDLVIDIFNGADVNLSMKKNLTDSLEEAINTASSTTKLDLGSPTISDGSQEGWVTFSFAFENVVRSFLAMFSDEIPGLSEMTIEDFKRIMNPDAVDRTTVDDTILTLLNDIITSVRLAVIIKKNSGEMVSRFFLDALESNDMFFDSAVKVLKDTRNWTEETLTEWSTMAEFSSLTDFNCLFRFAQFKVTEQDSVHVSTLSERNHTFEVSVTLPKMEVDPDDLRLLVNHVDSNLSFENEDVSARFKYLSGPEVVSIDPAGIRTATFRWNALDQTGTIRDTDISVTLLVSPMLQGDDRLDDDGDKKIGSTSQFKKVVGGQSNSHFASLKMRKAISLGIEDVSTLEESVSNFLESLFKLVFKISGLDGYSSSSSTSDILVTRSQLENAADEVANGFYTEMMNQETATLYEEIMTSEVFYSDEHQGDSNVAELLLRMLQSLMTSYSGDLTQIINILLDESGLKETDAGYAEKYDRFRVKFSAVFQMSAEELALDLSKYPSEKEQFISSGSVVADEIESITEASKELPSPSPEVVASVDDTRTTTSMPGPFSPATASRMKTLSSLRRSTSSTTTSSGSSGTAQAFDGAFDMLSASGMNIAREDFERVIVEPMRSLELESRMVSRQISAADFAATSLQRSVLSVPMKSDRSINFQSMGQKLDEKLVSMLNSASGSGDNVVGLFDSVKTAIENVVSPLDVLDDLINTLNDLASKASRLQSSISIFISMVIRIGSRCPLWPVKAIVNIIKNPLNMLKRAAQKGKDAIKRVSDKMRRNLKGVVQKRDKFRSLTDKFDKPTEVIGKFQEIMSSIVMLTSAGLVPVDLIQKFINATTLKGFFDTLNSNIGEVKRVFDGFNSNMSRLTRYVPSISSLLRSITDKFNVMKPIDNLFRRLKPWVDKAVNLFRRTFKWWLRYLFKVLLKPIEWTINTLLRPFKSTIRRIVDRINPFGGIYFFHDIEHRYINWIVSSSNAATSKIGFVESLSNSSAFNNIANTMADAVAIVLRAMYGLMSVSLDQFANSAEMLEGAISWNPTIMSALENLVKMEKGADQSASLSSILLSCKAETVDGNIAQVDSYLQNRVGNNPYSYVDGSGDSKIRNFIGDYHGRTYKFAPCFLDPQGDVASPYFERGTKSSWLNAPLAAILHHSQLVKGIKVLRGGTVPSGDYHEFGSGFVPQVSSDGRCTVNLFPWCNRNYTRSYTVDARLPVKEASLTPLPSDLSYMPSKLMQFVEGKIFAYTNECFSLAQRGSGSWAILEKVAITKFNMTSNRELIGTGVHMLSGLKGGMRYTLRSDGDWGMQRIALSGNSFRLNNSHFSSVPGMERLPSSALIEHIKSHTLSMDHIKILQSLSEMPGQEAPKIDASTKKDIIDQMNKLSMFIVLSSDGVSAHPIMCHDTTDDKNPLYTPGSLLQPLLDLGGVKEVWEYSISASQASPVVSTSHGSYSAQSVITPGRKSMAVMTIRRTLTSAPRKPIHLDKPLSLASVKDQIQQLASQVGRTHPNGEANLKSDKELARRELNTQLYPLMYKSITGLAFGRKKDKDGGTTSTNFAKGDVVVQKSNKRWLYVVDDDPYYDRKAGKTLFKLRQVDESGGRKVNSPVETKHYKHAEDEKCQTLAVLRTKGLFPNGTMPRNNRENIQFSETDQYKWGMTFKQFRDYMHDCMGVEKGARRPMPSSTEWIKNYNNKEVTTPGKEAPAKKGYVTAHNLNDSFVLKHTEGSGMGVALNLQANSTAGKATQVLISHAWNEDMEQVLSMLEDAKKERLPLQPNGVFDDNTVIWFCTLSQFQVNTSDNEQADRSGPTVSAQVAADPFEKVIKSNSCQNMIVLQSGVFDPNIRFWCSLELYTAIKQQKDGRSFNLYHRFSKEFLKTYVVTPKLKTAEGQPKRSWVKEGETWYLNDPALPKTEYIFQHQSTTWRKKFGQKKMPYTIFKKDEMKKFTQEDVDKAKNTLKWKNEWLTEFNVAVGEEWPRLRHDIFMSFYEKAGWEKKFADIGGNAKWMIMQNTLAENQEKSALEAMENAVSRAAPIFMY